MHDDFIAEIQGHEGKLVGGLSLLSVCHKSSYPKQVTPHQSLLQPRMFYWEYIRNNQNTKKQVEGRLVYLK